MRNCLDFSPLSSASSRVCEKIVYDLKILQQPKNTRESTAKKTMAGNDNVVRIYKRLLNPHPIVVLKVFSLKTSINGQMIKVDITSRVLSLYFMNITLIKDEQQAHGLIGTTTVSGTFYNIPDLETCSEKGVIVFKIDDIGLTEHGQYRLKLDLFKYEGFSDFTNTSSSCSRINTFSKLSKIGGVFSDMFEVFKASEYYKDSVQQVIQSQIQTEINRLSTNNVLCFLRSIKVIKDDAHNNKKKPFKAKSELNSCSLSVNNTPTPQSLCSSDFSPNKRSYSDYSQESPCSKRQHSLPSFTTPSLQSFIAQPAELPEFPIITDSSPTQMPIFNISTESNFSPLLNKPEPFANSLVSPFPDQFQPYSDLLSPHEDPAAPTLLEDLTLLELDEFNVSGASPISNFLVDLSPNLTNKVNCINPGDVQEGELTVFLSELVNNKPSSLESNFMDQPCFFA